jgi:(p)ppGpp synthase/HD superfamily hydrolase
MAVKAHEGQIRELTGSPFIVHPLAVMGILRTFRVKDEDVLIAAVLHDVVEDSSIELEEVEENFGNRVANLVNQATKKEDGKFIITDKEGAILKMADLIHNGLTMPKDKKQLKERYIIRVELLYKHYKDIMKEHPELLNYLKKILKRVKASR